MQQTTVGENNYVYQVAEGWGELPKGKEYGYTHGICVDAKGQVYVFHTGRDSVFVFSCEGTFIKSWGAEFEAGAHGFYLHQDGNGQEYLYMTDTRRGKMVKATLDGDVLMELGVPVELGLYDRDHPYMPTDVCVGPNGDIYVADGYGQYYIHQYDSGGMYLRTFGGRGSEPGKLLEPHGISVNLRGEEPELYIADRRNHRIQVFTMDGEHKRYVDAGLDLPCSFYFHGDEVYIPDLNSRVSILDEHDRLVTHLGEDKEAYLQEGWPNLPKSYFRPNQFSSPHGVCVDAHGDLYVVEWISDGRLTKLVRQS